MNEKEKDEDKFTYYIAAEKFTYDEATSTYAVNYGDSGWDYSAIEAQVRQEKKNAANSSLADDDGFPVTAEEVDQKVNEIVSTSLVEFVYNKYADENVKSVGRAAAAEYYRANAPKFLWVKNLWVPDLPWKHPVFTKLSEYDFYGSLTEANKAKEAEFNEITADLNDEKNQANGYLILVVLSIGIMFLSQFIMNRMQKDQMELQSVDGQAATTSKMMMWMMPIMFGVFAFIYTASFSLYMIISSVFSTLSTLIISFIVEKSFKKKMEQEEIEKDKRVTTATEPEKGKGKKQK